MPTISVSIADDVAEMVHRKVEAGLYGSPSEVVGEALRLMHERDRVPELTIGELQQKLARGLQQAENGDFSTRSVEEIIGEAKARKVAANKSL